MDLYHSIVFVGACIAFFAMYRLLSWFIKRRYYVPKVAPPKINETYGARRSRLDALIRANLEPDPTLEHRPRRVGSAWVEKEAEANRIGLKPPAITGPAM